MNHKAKHEKRPGAPWNIPGARGRNRVLYICLLVSALAHLLLIISVTPPWGAWKPRPKPRRAKPIALKLVTRAAVAPPPRAQAPAPKPVRPPAVRPAPQKAPPLKPEEKLARKGVGRISPKFDRSPAARTKEVMREKETEAADWVAGEFSSYKKSLARIEEGDVGFRRVIDLKGETDPQLEKLMEYFGMKLGYGGRVITDFNLHFTSAWLLTGKQIEHYLAKHPLAGSRRILAAIPSNPADVSLPESGDGKMQPYIEPTVKILAEILSAEGRYLSSHKIPAGELECLVFKPVWTRRGPAFEVVRSLSE